MLGIEEFKAKVRANQFESLLDEVLSNNEALHVSEQNIRKIQSMLAAKYGVSDDKLFVRVVGSAKFGFSLVEKQSSDGTILPRYRPFSARSDIDLLVIS